MSNSRFAKIFVFIALIFLIALPSFSYNPIYNAENYSKLSNPDMITGASSVTGGSLMGVTSSSIALNPALIAGEQRFSFDVDYTAMIPTCEGETYGQAAQLGFIIPSRYGVGSVVIQGVFADGISSMDFGNSFTVRTAFAKDLTDRLYVGIGLYGGYGPQVDYAVACDFGFWYMIQTISWLPFLSNARWGASITSMGKTFVSSNAGLYSQTGVSNFESPFTVRVGFAASLVELKNFKWGFSTDASFPSCQNAVFDVGTQFLICNIVKISTSWQANVRELVSGTSFSLPTAGVSVNFAINTSKDKNKEGGLAKLGWQENEAKVSSAYQMLSNGTHLSSVGFTAWMGQKDTEAPEIILWEE